MNALQPGLRGEQELVVEEEHTARHLGSGNVFVLATPMMIALMERASVAAVDHLLPEGQLTVGAHVDVRHLASARSGLEPHTSHSNWAASACDCPPPPWG